MKLTFNSPVVLIFSFVCGIVYLFTSNGIGTDYFILDPVWNFSSPSWYFKMFSHTIGHASIEHFMGNMAFFLLLGPIVEEKYGSKNLVIMFLTTAVVTGLIQIMFFDTRLLGASGIVFMLILLVSLVNFKNKEIPLTFVLIVIIYIGGEIWGTFDGREDGISHSTHIIGGIVGAVFGFALAGKKIRDTPKSTEILG
ncbi:rhomboid family intramembrane serine protease [Paracrocinitomix mangrovi]|uniref:rhomboid family intramembrane serine protease n=1 Tax=Paracrocinitomix mangrovi TaxID=2862509 RepID=UPI001C8D8E85|nr:rhomboid family intramembrane serine protease [Paracrocinitomix mangrovi]UKN02980.1 rhomboid family intramembrane serine protease [Paracrocinitomix mangrovi]